MSRAELREISATCLPLTRVSQALELDKNASLREMKALKDLSSVNQTVTQSRRRMGTAPNRSVCNALKSINVSNNRIQSIERLGTVIKDGFRMRNLYFMRNYLLKKTKIYKLIRF